MDETSKLDQLWRLALVAGIAGTVGGFGWRQIDPSAFTDQEGAVLTERVTALEIKTAQLPPVELLRAVDRMEYRLSLIETELNRLSKAYWQSMAQEKNNAQSHGQ